VEVPLACSLVLLSFQFGLLLLSTNFHLLLGLFLMYVKPSIVPSYSFGESPSLFSSLRHFLRQATIHGSVPPSSSFSPVPLHVPALHRKQFLTGDRPLHFLSVFPLPFLR